MSTSDKQFLKALNQVIDKRISESDLSSTTLAPDFFFSPRHFNRKVNAATGMNTTLYIRRRRLEHACELLRATRLSISAIFLECGFESANYFSRIFRQEMGMTPSAYRKGKE